jgi:hypothetical protein
VKRAVRAGLLAVAVVAWSSAASGDAPLSSTGVTRWSATTGFIDPTVPTFNGSAPMRCTASTSVSSAFTEQNRAALQVALNLASSTRQWIYLPPCQTDALAGSAVCSTSSGCAYPISKKAGSICGVDFTGLSNINIVGNGGMIRQYANPAGAAEFDMICVRGTAHIKFIGVEWSQRDVRSSDTEQIHLIAIGGGTPVADDVLIFHNRFLEPALPAVSPATNRAGDCIRILGSSVPSTNTRINIIENHMRCRRSSLGIQRGFQYVNFVGNNTFGVTDQDVDFEPTSEGKIHNLLVTNNIFDRRGSPNSVAITLGGTSGTSLSVGTVVADNTIIEGSVTASGNASQIWVRNNFISSGISRADATANVEMFRRISDYWVTGNHIYRGPLALANDGVSVRHQINNCAGGGPNCHPESVWVDNNRIEIHSSDAAAISHNGVLIDSVRDAWVNDNTITYHGAAADVGLNGPVGINVQSTGDTASSGWFSENEIRRSVQEDGVTPAGRMLTGILINSSTFAEPFAIVRDNLVSGARMILFANASNATLLPNGPPVMSGNFGFLTGSSTADVVGGGVVTNESFVGIDHAAAAGVVSVSTRSTILTSYCLPSVLTLPSCEIDGLIKSFTLLSGGCLVADTLNIAGFGDGTSLTWTLAPAATASFRLACDASESTWWLLDKTAGITVNP